MFFNALGIKYEYEPEGYDLGNGLYYLPDFWLPEQDCWVEVKGKRPLPGQKNQDLEKCAQLALQSRKPVYMLFDCAPLKVIRDENKELKVLNGNLRFHFTGSYSDPWALGYCKACSCYTFGFYGDYCNLCDSQMLPLTETLFQAYRKARQARFEHSTRKRW